LYEDHIANTTDDAEDGAAKGNDMRPLSDVTTAVKNKSHSKNFGSQFEINDNSPDAEKKTMPSHETRSSMNTHWGTHQDSPGGRGINIAGNGMGSRKGTEWSLFDEEPAKKENKHTGARITEGDGMGGRKTGEKSFWDF
jgi:site-specific DNA-cytosine methylase